MPSAALDLGGGLSQPGIVGDEQEGRLPGLAVLPADEAADSLAEEQVEEVASVTELEDLVTLAGPTQLLLLEDRVKSIIAQRGAEATA